MPRRDGEAAVEVKAPAASGAGLQREGGTWHAVGAG